MRGLSLTRFRPVFRFKPRLSPRAYATSGRSGTRIGISPMRIMPVIRILPRLSLFAWAGMGLWSLFGGQKKKD